MTIVENFYHWLEHKDGVYATVFLIMAFGAVLSRNAMDFVQGWRRWKENVNLLEQWKLRLEVEKLRFEVLALQRNLKSDDLLLTPKGLPLASIEELIDELTPDEGKPKASLRDGIMHMLTDLPHVKEWPNPFAKRPFKPWGWLTKLHQWSPWLSGTALMATAVVASLCLMVSLMLLLGFLISSAKPQPPGGDVAAGHIAFVVMMFSVGVFSVAAFLIRRAWLHARLFGFVSRRPKVPEA